ncbi:MAG: DNA polymerase IV [Algoriphagus sp.]|nr:DNA polymerase IV [Algoriphagus sp.]
MEEKRSIVHLDLDTFFVSVERLFDDRLKGKPILIGGASDRGVVASCSYEARKFGVHSAMPMRTARQLCPEAIVVRGDFEKYSQKSQEITEIIREGVPLFEKASIDEFYIDLTGMDRFFGCFKLAHELRQRIIQESGLNISMGLSQNKTVSKIATGEAKPNNEKQIPLGEEKTFLSPLSVRKIPMIGEKTSQTLYNMGVKKVQTLQQMPAQLLEATEATLIAMTEQLSTKLRKKGQLTACITVKIRYSDFETHSIQQRIPYTAADHSLLPLVKELFRKLYTRRLLIRLVGVRFSHLVYGNYQIQLFEDSQQQINLYQALDKLNVKYGDKTVCRAVAMGVGSRRFNPFNGLEN